MNNEDKLSRSETAKILGVTPQTVSNLAKRGILTEIKYGRVSFYPRNEVDAIAPKVADLSNLEQRLQEIIEEKESLLKNEMMEVAGLKRKYSEVMHGYNNLHRYTEILQAVIEGLALRDKDLKILTGVLNFKTLDEIADENGLLPSNVQRNYNKAIRRLKSSIPNTQNELDRLSHENLVLKRKLEVTEVLIKESSLDKDHVEIDKVGDINAFFLQSIYDFPFSVRAVNCMKTIGIITIEDLVSKHREDLSSCRVFGRKTLTEIDNFLESYGLFYGMTEEDMSRSFIEKSASKR